MKKTILAGAIAAMMLASAATSAVTFAQDNNAKIVTVTSAAKASGKNSVVKPAAFQTALLYIPNPYSQTAELM